MSLAPKKYDSMLEAVNSLTKRGFTFDFNFEDGFLRCSRIGKCYSPTDLLITEVYRFEGMSDPTDNAVVYAIESGDGIRGILVDAYGAYSDEYKDLFLKDIPVKTG